MTTYLTKEDILDIHEKVQKKFNDPPGILNKGNLGIIVDIPQRTVFGKEIYTTIYQKAAALLVNMINLHAFVETNKRTAILAVETFLQMNGIDWIVPLKATRLSVIIAKSEIEMVDKMIIKSSLFLSNYSLDYNDPIGSIRNIEWMVNEINDFMPMSKQLRDSLLDYWLVETIYPEIKENRDSILAEYISNLTSSTNVYLDTMKDYQP